MKNKVLLHISTPQISSKHYQSLLWATSLQAEPGQKKKMHLGVIQTNTKYPIQLLFQKGRKTKSEVLMQKAFPMPKYRNFYINPESIIPKKYSEYICSISSSFKKINKSQHTVSKGRGLENGSGVLSTEVLHPNLNMALSRCT